MWNSTKALPPGFFPISTGAVVPWKNGIQWNVTIPKEKVPLDIKCISDGVILARLSEGAAADYCLFAGYSAKTGQKLWPSPGAQGVLNLTTPMTNQCVGGSGIFVQHYNIERRYHAFNLFTGQEIWQSDPPESYPWGTYTDNSPVIAYGMLYAQHYDGYMYAFDIKTGKLAWKFYSGDAGLETPYGTRPLFANHILAGGRVIAHNDEHTPTYPLYRGQRIYVMDANTGDLIWSMEGWLQQKAVADGYLVAFNSYDGRVYCFGKGQTATTVSAPQTAVANGSSVLIQGTVLDQSPGQPGTPCVSAKSMSQWMEYLHMQKSMPTNTTGVPVQLRAMRSDGSLIEIGTVTSDVSGHYAYKWTPPTPDTYKITASFVGDDSYGSSWAETGLAVDPAPAAAEPIEIPAYPDYTPLFAGLIVAVVIAIVIGLVNLFWKRK